MGDAPTDAYMVALRAVQATEFMAVQWAPLPADPLARVSSRIIDEVHGINRIVHDLFYKRRATIEWE